jgi:hypothetical protein
MDDDCLEQAEKLIGIARKETEEIAQMLSTSACALK